mgnify:CR=1 FL=1
MPNNSNVKHFRYTKANGQKSERTAYFIHGATDLALAIDLSEFDEPERAYYEAKLDAIRKEFYDNIRDIGLGGNIRSFKGEGIMFFEEMEHTAKMAGRVV